MVFLLRSLKILGLVLIILFGAISICIAQESRPGITPLQKEQLKDLAAEAKRKAMRERNDLRRARMDLFQIYKSYDMDERKAKAALAVINNAQLNLLNLHLQNQIELRQILNEQQFKVFKKRMTKFRNHSMGVMPPRAEQLLENLPDREMLKSAGISREQLRKSSMTLNPKREKIKVIEKLRRDSIKMMELYSNYDLDTQTARKLIQSIHDSQSDLSELNHKKQQNLRSLLTESQFVQVRDKIEKKMREKLPRQDSSRK